MSLHRRSRALAYASTLLVLCAWSLPARAWTHASVESAEAHLDVQTSGQARVSLTLGIRVTGGWLSRFEIAGLEPGLVLEPDQPATLASENGSELIPRTETTADGRIVFSFPEKKEAPRRGLHRLTVNYTSPLTPADGTFAKNRHVFSWSMPAWQVDLRQTDIWIDAPAGARFAAMDPDSDSAAVHERFDRGARTVLHLHRALLPRTVSFSAQLELVSAPRLAQNTAAQAPIPRSRSLIWVPVFVILVASLKRRAVLTVCKHSGVRNLPLLECKPLMRVALGSVFSGGFAHHYETRPGFALALLAGIVVLVLDRGFARLKDPAPLTLLSGQHTRTWPYALLGPPSWLDATTPLGLGLLGSLYALAALRLALGTGPSLWLEVVLLVTPLWLTGTRLQICGHHSAEQHATAYALSDAAARSTRHSHPGARPASQP